MRHDIATANHLTRGQESAVLLKIAEQTGIQNVGEAAKAFLQGSFEIVRIKIVDVIGTATTSTTADKFVAKDKFITDSKGIKFKGISGNFTKWFLGGDGKIEEPIGEKVLRYGNLIKHSTDGPIMEELGGETKVETSLTELYDLLIKQSNGEEGVLLTNGHANIFWIRDIGGVMRTFFVCWESGYWLVYVYYNMNPRSWSAGTRVFFRSS